jgi:hypothetical protein
MGRYLGTGECKKCHKPAWTCRCFKDPRIPRKKKDEQPSSEDVSKTCATCKTPTDHMTRVFVNGAWYHPGCDYMGRLDELEQMAAAGPSIPQVPGGPVPVNVMPSPTVPSVPGGPVPIGQLEQMLFNPGFIREVDATYTQAQQDVNPDEDPQDWDEVEE